jgi:hypothetical protein
VNGQIHVPTGLDRGRRPLYQLARGLDGINKRIKSEKEEEETYKS